MSAYWTWLSFGAAILVALASSINGNTTIDWCDPSLGKPCRTNTSLCVPLINVGDGFIDCPDGSDEGCAPDSFICRDLTKCLPPDLRQNGMVDCPDESDEDCEEWQHECLCGFPRCVDKALIADGKLDCSEGSDEFPFVKNTYICPEYFEVDQNLRRRRSQSQEEQNVIVNDEAITNFVTLQGIDQSTGLLSSSVVTFINDGTTSEYITKVHGSKIDDKYVHITTVSSRVFYPAPTKSAESSSVGLVSTKVQSVVNEAPTTLVSTRIYHTHIDGTFAQLTETVTDIVNGATPPLPTSVGEQHHASEVKENNFLNSQDKIDANILDDVAPTARQAGEHKGEVIIVDLDMEPKPSSPTDKALPTFTVSQSDVSLEDVVASNAKKATRPERVGKSLEDIRAEFNFDRNEQKDSDMPTVTYVGFADFTTTIADTVVVFMPRSIQPGKSVSIPTKSKSLPVVLTLAPRLASSQAEHNQPEISSISTKIFNTIDLYPTGLVSSIGGTIVHNDVTTVIATNVYGTFIEGQYAQVVQSTSSIFYLVPSSVMKEAHATAHEGEITAIENPDQEYYDYELDGSATGGRNDKTQEVKDNNLGRSIGGGSNEKKLVNAIANDGDHIHKEQKDDSVTTLTFYTTFFKDGHTTVSTRHETSRLFVLGREKPMQTKSVDTGKFTVETLTFFTTQLLEGTSTLLSHTQVLTKSTEPSSVIHSLLPSGLEEDRSVTESVSESTTDFSLQDVTDKPDSLESSFNFDDDTNAVFFPRTYYTTYTYFTTFYKSGTSSIVSSFETHTNVVTDADEQEQHKTITPIVPTYPVTYFTTYTYWTTYFKDNATVTSSSEKTVSNEVTLLAKVLATEMPDIQATHRFSSLQEAEVIPEFTTFFTTFTYYTSTYIGESTVINSRFETVTNVITASDEASVVTNEPDDIEETTGEPDSEHQPVGLLSTIRGSTVIDDTTTVFSTNIYGTIIDGLYARIQSTTSQIIEPPVTKVPASSSSVALDSSMQNSIDSFSSKATEPLIANNHDSANGPGTFKTSRVRPDFIPPIQRTSFRNRPGLTRDGEFLSQSVQAFKALNIGSISSQSTEETIEPQISQLKLRFRSQVTDAQVSTSDASNSESESINPSISIVKPTRNRLLLSGTRTPGLLSHRRPGSTQEPEILTTKPTVASKEESIQIDDVTTENSVTEVRPFSFRAKPTPGARSSLPFRNRRPSENIEKTTAGASKFAPSIKETPQIESEATHKNVTTEDTPSEEPADANGRLSLDERRKQRFQKARPVLSKLFPRRKSNSDDLEVEASEVDIVFIDQNGHIISEDLNVEESNLDYSYADADFENRYDDDLEYEASEIDYYYAEPNEDVHYDQEYDEQFSSRKRRQADFGARKTSRGVTRFVQPNENLMDTIVDTPRVKEAEQFTITNSRSPARSQTSKKQTKLNSSKRTVIRPQESAMKSQASPLKPEASVTKPQLSVINPASPIINEPRTEKRQVSSSRSSTRSHVPFDRVFRRPMTDNNIRFTNRFTSQAQGQPSPVLIENKGQIQTGHAQNVPNIFPSNDGSLPQITEPLTVTRKVPATTTIPFVEGGKTSQKEVLTASMRTEIIQPHEITQTVIDGSRRLLLSSLVEGSDITQVFIQPISTTSVTYTKTMIQGRQTSASHVVPSTVFNVVSVTTTKPGGELEQLLRMILMPQQQQQHPLLAALGLGSEPTTSYKFHTSTYVTTVTNLVSNTLPIIFRGKKVETTIINSKTEVITATEVSTETIVSPTAANANPLTQLLPLLLKDQVAQPIKETPVQSEAKLTEKNNLPNQESESTSVVTLFVSGKRPGDFSTLLSTVTLDQSDSTRIKRGSVSMDILLPTALPQYIETDKGLFKLPNDYNTDDIDWFIMSAMNEIDTGEVKKVTPDLESIMHQIMEKELRSSYNLLPNVKYFAEETRGKNSLLKRTARNAQGVPLPIQQGRKIEQGNEHQIIDDFQMKQPQLGQFNIPGRRFQSRLISEHMKQILQPTTFFTTFTYFTTLVDDNGKEFVESHEETVTQLVAQGHDQFDDLARTSLHHFPAVTTVPVQATFTLDDAIIPGKPRPVPNPVFDEPLPPFGPVISDHLLHQNAFIPITVSDKAFHEEEFHLSGQDEGVIMEPELDITFIPNKLQQNQELENNLNVNNKLTEHGQSKSLNNMNIVQQQISVPKKDSEFLENVPKLVQESAEKPAFANDDGSAQIDETTLTTELPSVGGRRVVVNRRIPSNIVLKEDKESSKNVRITDPKPQESDELPKDSAIQRATTRGRQQHVSLQILHSSLPENDEVLATVRTPALATTSRSASRSRGQSQTSVNRDALTRLEASIDVGKMVTSQNTLPGNGRVRGRGTLKFTDAATKTTLSGNGFNFLSIQEEESTMIFPNEKQFSPDQEGFLEEEKVEVQNSALPSRRRVVTPTISSTAVSITRRRPVSTQKIDDITTSQLDLITEDPTTESTTAGDFGEIIHAVPTRPPKDSVRREQISAIRRPEDALKSLEAMTKHRQQNPTGIQELTKSKLINDVPHDDYYEEYYYDEYTDDNTDSLLDVTTSISEIRTTISEVSSTSSNVESTFTSTRPRFVRPSQLTITTSTFDIIEALKRERTLTQLKAPSRTRTNSHFLRRTKSTLGEVVDPTAASNVVYSTYATMTLLPILGGEKSITLNILTSVLTTLADDELHLLTDSPELFNPALITTTLPPSIATLTELDSILPHLILVEEPVPSSRIALQITSTFITPTLSSSIALDMDDGLPKGLLTRFEQRAREQKEATGARPDVQKLGARFSIGSRHNLATKVMSNGVEVIVAGDKATSPVPHEQTISNNFEKFRRPITLPPSTLSDQVLLFTSADEDRTKQSAVETVVTNANNKYFIPPDIKVTTLIPKSVLVNRSTLVSPLHHYNRIKKGEVIANALVTKIYVTTITYVTQMAGTGDLTRIHLQTNVVTHDPSATRVLTPSVTAQVTLLAGGDDGFHQTNTYFTTLTYYNTMMAGTRPFVITSKETLSNVMTVNLPETGNFIERTEIKFDTHTYFTTQTFSRTEEDGKVSTSEEVITQMVVTEAPTIQRTSLPLASTTVITKTYFTTLTYYTTKLTGDATVVDSETAISSEVVTETTVVSPTPTVALTDLVSATPTPSLEGSVFEHQDEIVLATKTFYTTSTFLTTILEGSETKTSSRTEIFSNVVTDTLTSKLDRDHLYSLHSNALSASLPEPQTIGYVHLRDNVYKQLRTLFATYTHFRTLSDGVVNSREETKTKVLTSTITTTQVPSSLLIIPTSAINAITATGAVGGISLESSVLQSLKNSLLSAHSSSPSEDADLAATVLVEEGEASGTFVVSDSTTSATLFVRPQDEHSTSSGLLPSAVLLDPEFLASLKSSIRASRPTSTHFVDIIPTALLTDSSDAGETTTQTSEMEDDIEITASVIDFTTVLTGVDGSATTVLPGETVLVVSEEGNEPVLVPHVTANIRPGLVPVVIPDAPAIVNEIAGAVVPAVEAEQSSLFSFGTLVPVLSAMAGLLRGNLNNPLTAKSDDTRRKTQPLRPPPVLVSSQREPVFIPIGGVGAAMRSKENPQEPAHGFIPLHRPGPPAFPKDLEMFGPTFKAPTSTQWGFTAMTENNIGPTRVSVISGAETIFFGGVKSGDMPSPGESGISKELASQESQNNIPNPTGNSNVLGQNHDNGNWEEVKSGLQSSLSPFNPQLNIKTIARIEGDNTIVRTQIIHAVPVDEYRPDTIIISTVSDIILHSTVGVGFISDHNEGAKSLLTKEIVTHKAIPTNSFEDSQGDNSFLQPSTVKFLEEGGSITSLFLGPEGSQTQLITRIETLARTVTATSTELFSKGDVTSSRTHFVRSTLPLRTIISTVVGSSTHVNFITATQGQSISSVVASPVQTALHSSMIAFKSNIGTNTEDIHEDSEILNEANFGIADNNEISNVVGNKNPDQVVEVGSPVRVPVSLCFPQCSVSRMEVCRVVKGDHRCVCQPGYARRHFDDVCRPSRSFLVRLLLDRVSDEKLVFDPILKDISHPITQDLSDLAINGIDLAMAQSELGPHYHGTSVTRYSDVKDVVLPLNAKPRERGLVVEMKMDVADDSSLRDNNEEDLIDEEMLRRMLELSLRSTNYSLGGTEVYASQEVAILAAADFDECSSGDHNDCSVNAHCFNLAGSFTCACKDGFRDLDEVPGRNCAVETERCASCSYQGECIRKEDGSTGCRCQQWFSGDKCHINLRVLLIVLVSVGALLIAMLVVCLVMCCLRSRRRNQMGQMSGAPTFLRSRGLAMSNTLDRTAMIPDTASESSGEHSRFRAGPFLPGKHLDRNGRIIGAPRSELSVGNRSQMSFAEDRSFSVHTTMAPVLIPRVKGAAPPRPVMITRDGGRSDLGNAESALLDLLEHSGNNGHNHSRRNSGAASIHSVARGMNRSRSHSREHLQHGVNQGSMRSKSSDRHSHHEMGSEFGANYSYRYGGDRTVSEMRSYDETTVRPPIRTLGGESFVSSKALSQHISDDNQTMAERDTGSTVIFPHTELYRPMQDNDSMSESSDQHTKADRSIASNFFS